MKLDKAVIAGYSKPDLKVHIYDMLLISYIYQGLYLSGDRCKPTISYRSGQKQLALARLDHRQVQVTTDSKSRPYFMKLTAG